MGVQDQKFSDLIATIVVLVISFVVLGIVLYLTGKGSPGEFVVWMLSALVACAVLLADYYLAGQKLESATYATDDPREQFLVACWEKRHPVPAKR